MVSSSPSNLDRSVPTSDKVLDRVVSACDLKDADLDLSVSPPIEEAVGDGGEVMLRNVESEERGKAPTSCSEETGSREGACYASIHISPKNSKKH